MAEKRVQRRLAAILAADVVGYSRLMGEDEEGTLAALTAHIKELIEPCIDEHRGRVVKTTGDGLLAEFASVVDAVRCAVAFQEGMVERNADTPEDRRIAGDERVLKPAAPVRRGKSGAFPAAQAAAPVISAVERRANIRISPGTRRPSPRADFLTPVFAGVVTGFAPVYRPNPSSLR